MSTQREIVFPCAQVPDDPARFKLLGLVQQRQEGRWMQRVAVRGGLLTPDQWRTLGQVARDLTPQTPLHLTTRQDVELHNLTAEQVPLAQGMIAEAGLTGLGAGGDSLRNITVCPCSGILKEAVSLHPIAEQIRQRLEAEAGILSLPRKFKISFSCSLACAQPWINDLGFVAGKQGEQLGFRVMAGGSLGARPGTGMLLFEWLGANDVLPLVVAAVRVFAAHGDREHRNKARLRHVRERVGDQEFANMLIGELKAVKAERAWPEISLPEGECWCEAIRVLTFPNGDISPAAAEAIGELAGHERLFVRISNHHRVLVYGPDEPSLEQAIEELPALHPHSPPQPQVVACPGTRWCSRALVDTNSMADRIRTELSDKLPPQLTVCISGCPNGCAHSAVADIGLTGQLVTRDGQRIQAYNLLAGGGMGRTAKLAQPIASKLSADEVIARIKRLLDKGIA